jgi:hypothetical protein
MERSILVKYLIFLRERADAIAKKEPIEDYDVSVLKRELSDFKTRVRGVSTGSAALDQSITALEVQASERDASGDNAGIVRLAMKLLFGRGLAWQELERKRQLRVKTAIRNFRDQVSHIQFALEL